MFSLKQKRDIANKVQEILRETNHPELPVGEIQFTLHVVGAESWSWADIRNNGAVTIPGVNPHNELQDAGQQPCYVYAHIKHYGEGDSIHNKVKMTHQEVENLFDPNHEVSDDEDGHQYTIKKAIHSDQDGQTVGKHRADWNNSQSLSVSADRYEKVSIGIHPTKAGATENMRKADGDSDGEEWVDDEQAGQWQAM